LRGRSLAEFAVAYADLNEQDYRALLAAAHSDRIPVLNGM
jgi:hypothetical protein